VVERYALGVERLNQARTLDLACGELPAPTASRMPTIGLGEASFELGLELTRGESDTLAELLCGHMSPHRRTPSFAPEGGGRCQILCIPFAFRLATTRYFP
jgi:hypothetical protein